MLEDTKQRDLMTYFQESFIEEDYSSDNSKPLAPLESGSTGSMQTCSVSFDYSLFKAMTPAIWLPVCFADVISIISLSCLTISKQISVKSVSITAGLTNESLEREQSIPRKLLEQN